LSATSINGIPGLDLQAGDHICAFYRGPERDGILVPFLLEGLRTGDKCVCVIDASDLDDLMASLDKPSATDCLQRRQLEFYTSESTYLAGGEFVPDRMMEFWDDNIRAALGEGGYTFVRLVGEMSWGLSDLPGVDQLVAYEAELNRHIHRYPQVNICLYDVERFSGAMILDTLSTHPSVLLNGMVVDNPYYVEPDEFLAGRG
jgi:MEDS: MEthanogen/methylotroph, DcmR Sensory domain